MKRTGVEKSLLFMVRSDLPCMARKLVSIPMRASSRPEEKLDDTHVGRLAFRVYGEEEPLGDGEGLEE